MKKISKVLSVFLSLLMVISIIPMADITANAATYSGKCGDNVFWSFDEYTSTLTISGTGAMYNYSHYLHNCYSDYHGSYVDYSPQWNYYNLEIKKVIISYGVTTIGNDMFCGCESLIDIVIPNSVTTIGETAFFNCSSLTNIKIPDSVTEMGGGVFYNCSSLKSVILSNEIKSIDAFEDIRNQYCYGFFEGCTSLENIVIPDNIINMCGDVFEDCDSLMNVTIGKGITHINSSQFNSCKNLKSITVKKDNLYYSSDEFGVLFNKDKTMLIKYPIGNARTSYEVPDSVTVIGDSAFAHCENLTKVVIPDSVTTIEDSAFAGCNKLTNVDTHVHEFVYDWTDYYPGPLYLDIYICTICSYEDYRYGNDELFSSWSIQDPTCTEYGWMELHSNYFETETIIIPPLGFDEHDMRISGKDEYCDKIGDEYLYCSRCEYWKRNDVPPLGHDYGDFTIDKAPTCTTVGSKSQHCTRCNSQSNVTEIPATGHTLTWHTLSVATCQTDGVAHGYCDNCDYYEVETISKTDHADNNGDGECDTCDLVLCDHDCHKGGFAGFIWMITNFFNRLFGSNKTCSCGVAHY